MFHAGILSALRPDLLPPRSYSPQCPPAPDLFFKCERGIVGIEHTRLLSGLAENGFSERQVEQAREDMIQRAKAIHEDSAGYSVFVIATFLDNAKVIPGEFASELAGFVANNRPSSSETFISYASDGSKGHPPWLFAVTIWNAKADGVTTWSGSVCSETKRLERESVHELIAKKQRKIPAYREHCNELWLLMVADLWPASSNFHAPDEACNWSFEHEFDKVIVLCGRTQVLEF
ncbi:MAG TPA: hypothetical protein VKM35_00715 [Arenimonas sp.]|uniref:hypothetical protein n=1 Tax=Arenimonas sp. TaxID=1872635 RepID=UPI002C50ED7E|nr:hypothetical protein [Arenimonas sp.]HMB55711.1 hypothetical protein [Arenimonas sp.]